MADRERTLRMRVAQALAAQGLRLDPGLTIQIVTGGEVVASDPITSTDDPYAQLRSSIRLPATFSDDGLVERIIPFARESIRRQAMHKAYHAARSQNCYAPGWTSLAHPLAIALLARLRVPLDRHPAGRSIDAPNQMKPFTGRYDTVRTWEILSINLSATFIDTFVSLETKSGRCWMQIDGQYPETIVDTIIGKPITTVLGIPQLAKYGVKDVIRRHALAVDAALADSRISSADNMGNHLSIELEPMKWLPFGPPPDEKTEKLLSLNNERH